MEKARDVVTPDVRLYRVSGKRVNGQYHQYGDENEKHKKRSPTNLGVLRPNFQIALRPNFLLKLRNLKMWIGDLRGDLMRLPPGAECDERLASEKTPHDRGFYHVRRAGGS
jgi:hypothetical protein